MAALNFQDCLDFTLSWEGGFVDNPADHGGATNMGITQETLSDWYGRAVSVQEVQVLPRAVVASIYQARYWQPVNGSGLPIGVDLMVFDFGVTSGAETSAMRLQGLFRGLRQDGVIGPLTLAAVRDRAPDWIIAALSQVQAAHYRQIVVDDPTQAEFLDGWLNRCTARMKAAQDMANG